MLAGKASTGCCYKGLIRLRISYGGEDLVRLLAEGLHGTTKV